MNLWSRFFPDKKNKDSVSEKSKYVPEETIPSDIMFAKNFTTKGGRFLFNHEDQNIKAFLTNILKENNWTTDEIISFDLQFAEKFELNYVDKKQTIKDTSKALFLDCEYLISSTGGILVCDKQIRNFKKDDLPQGLIIYAKLDQLVADLSDGMTKINKKYYEKRPTNITTIESKLLEEGTLTSSKSTNSKIIYLILEDI